MDALSAGTILHRAGKLPDQEKEKRK